MNPGILSFVYIGSAIVSIYLSVKTFKRRNDTMSTTLSLLLAGASLWSFFYGIEISATSLWLIRLCVSTEYIGIVTIPVLWLFYALRFTGNEKKFSIAFFIIPTINFLTEITNSKHHLFYKTSEIRELNGYFYHYLVPGPFYILHLIYSYTIIIIGIILVFRLYSKVEREVKQTVSFILLGAVVPCAVSIFYVLGYKPLGFIDLTPFGFLVMGIILMIGVFNNNLFDIKPLALSSLFDCIPDGIFVLNLSNQIINTNPAAKKILENEKIKKALTDFIKKEIPIHIHEINTEIEISSASKTYTLTFNPIFNRHNEKLGSLLVLHEITNRKVAENALREREEQFKELTEIFPEVIYEADMQGNITYVNEHGFEKFGVPKSDYRELNMLNFVDEEDKPLVINRLQERLEGKKGSFHEYKAKKVNGENFNALAYTANIIKNGNVTGIRGFILDITEQKNALELQQLLVNIADKYINTPIETVEQTINESLKDIGKFVKADRSYIFEYDWKNNVCNNTYEWCNDNISSEISNLQNVSLEFLSGWVDTHKRNQPLFINDVMSLEPENLLRRILEPQGIKSLLSIPMMNEGRCIGFAGFDSVKKQHLYTDKERILLQSFAQMIVNLINRKNANDLLCSQLKVQQLINNISSDLVSVDNQNLDQKINNILEQTGEFFGADRSYILRYFDNLKLETNTHEWCGATISSQKDTIVNTDLKKFPWWKSQIQKKQIIYIKDTALLPEDAIAEKEDFIRQGIKSIICFPIINNNSLIGYFGFDSVNETHEWTDSQREVIVTLTNILGDAFIKVENEIELIKSKEIAISASLAKSEFLSNMSHEIRTPLNGVIGFTDLLRNTQLTDVQKEYLDNAITSANSLLGVISDILDFSKIEVGKLELEVIKTDIIQLFENAMDIVKVNASNKGIELLLNIQPDIARFAWIDPIRLKQILVNLMGNAVKFTTHGEVELKVEFRKRNNGKGDYQISIRDTGIGIKEEQKDKLFKAFSQADTSTTRRYGGTGLGLIISNSLAKKMGTKISFESTYEVGSTFYFSLETNYEYGEELIHTDSLKHLRKVLIIDDNKNNRTILDHTFGYWGIESVCCENGPAAINWITENSDVNFDLILVDYHMPYLNGIETIRIMRDILKHDIEREPVILLHSSLDDVMVHKQVQELHINYMLTKPVKADELYYYLTNLNNHKIVKNIISNQNPEKKNITIDNDKPYKILIAEDTKMNMILITRILKDLIPKTHIFEAVNGEEAINILQKNELDLILMDVQMPILDGIETTIKIRKNKQYDNIPIIALTAGVTKEEREKCFTVGMNDFLAKPIHKKELQLKLIKHLNINNLIESRNENIVLPNELHFDKHNLLEKTGNNVDILNNMLDLARIEFPKYINELEKAAYSKDHDRIRKSAHKLKGSSYNMEFKLLGDQASAIEGNIDKFEKIIEKIDGLKLEWEEITSLFK